MITEKSNAALYVLALDISRDILSKLPVKSLLRFKCVRKSWCNLIEDPTFIVMHMKSFGKNRDDFLLCNSFNYQIFKHYRGSNNSVEREETLMSSRSLFRKKHGYIVGSINGLVCLVDAFFSFYRDEISRPKIWIWNPSTRKIMELPGCEYRLDHCMTAYHVFGFGFCPKTNDYKVVKITGDNFFKTPLEVGLYNLSTNSWKYMIITNPGWVLLPLLESSVVITFINGASHWLGYRIRSPGTGRMFIMSFKFDKEMFEEIAMPISNLKDPKNSVYFVTEYQNLLSLILQTVLGMLDIWVMKEYGVAESWSKQFNIVVENIPVSVRMIEPSIVSFGNKNGTEVLLLYYENNNEERRMVWYNIETKRIEDKGLHPVMQVISCKESLVSLS